MFISFNLLLVYIVSYRESWELICLLSIIMFFIGGDKVIFNFENMNEN